MHRQKVFGEGGKSAVWWWAMVDSIGTFGLGDVLRYTGQIELNITPGGAGTFFSRRALTQPLTCFTWLRNDVVWIRDCGGHFFSLIRYQNQHNIRRCGH